MDAAGTTGAGQRPPARRWAVWLFRAASTVAAVMLFDQAVFAGQFLDGSYGSLETHRENATFAGITVLATLASAILLRWPGRGPWLPVLGYAGIFGLIVIQIMAGFARTIWLHVPLGVTIIGLAAGLAVWAWRRP